MGHQTQLDVRKALRPGWQIWATAAVAILPPERLSGSECAQRYVVQDGMPFSFERTPYLVEPLDVLTSGRYRRVAIMGSAQSAKSKIADLWLAHSAIVDPMNMIWFQVDKALMRDYVVSRVNPMIRSSPHLAQRLLPTDSADNIHSKEFRGMQVWFAWPVAGQFRMRSAAKYVLDDFDDIPEDIEGQGDPISLAEGRQTSYEGKGTGAVISSPSLSPSRGIEAQFGQGTRKAWQWPCPECRAYFEADFLATAHFDRTGTAEDADRSLVLICPHCGTTIEPKHKAWMNQRGRWVGPLQHVTPATGDDPGAVEGPDFDTSIASYRIDGAMGFARWGELAAKWRAAELTFEQLQDEGPLRTFHNVQIGRNYTSQLAGAAPIEASDLGKRRFGQHQLGTVPDWVKVLIATVDTQANRWEVAVFGFGDGLRWCIVDRYSVNQLEDGRTQPDPAKHPEHWRVLLSRVIWRRYPLASDPSITVPIYNTAIDINGTDGREAFNKAGFAFWYMARRLGVRDESLTLIKGGNNPRAVKLPEPTFLERKRKGGVRRRGCKFWVPNVNAYKTILDARLRRETPGPGYLHLAEDLHDRYLDELVAEERDPSNKDLWIKRPGVSRNETLDLAVYAMVALERPPGAGERTTMGWVPHWARPVLPAEVEAAAEREAPSGPDPLPGPDDAPAPPPDEASPSSDRLGGRRLPSSRRKGGFVNSWR